jgi:hypothetical protein
MTLSMYTASIPVFVQHLNGLNTVLDKAAAWAAARKVNEADLLNMRLSPDMFNLARQVRAATDHAANAAGRLAGKELLKSTNDETSIAQLKDRITRTIDYLKSVKQSEIDGTEDKDIGITFPSGQTRQFTGQGLLLGNSLPNFWFHITTAYELSGTAVSKLASAISWAHRPHSRGSVMTKLDDRRKENHQRVGCLGAQAKQPRELARRVSVLSASTERKIRTA